jgi:hypothetical protein
MQPEAELEELTQIYVKRGLTHVLAAQVVVPPTPNDARHTHLRNELAIVEHKAPLPVEATLTSAVTFAAGVAFLAKITFIMPPRIGPIMGIPPLRRDSIMLLPHHAGRHFRSFGLGRIVRPGDIWSFRLGGCDPGNAEQSQQSDSWQFEQGHSASPFEVLSSTDLGLLLAI